MNRFRLLAIALLAFAFLAVIPSPAGAHEPMVLLASGARTSAGSSALLDVAAWRNFTVFVRVSSGSGTVTTFRVWLEGTSEGTLWQEIPCYSVLKTGATAPGAASAAQRDIVNETALVTSAQYSAICEVYTSSIRVAWNIVGSTPSETFAVWAAAK